MVADKAVVADRAVTERMTHSEASGWAFKTMTISSAEEALEAALAAVAADSEGAACSAR